ncbi:hypothetical protein SAMD00019534_053220 [Acytostelium subglobosum LB1]|uniref:hypothetical protein n=1 Tax=Acytostelium subglobosum LB1 TaxID=1410327 RepID=UPI000644CACE|nr:hypothetical protein SAMD00019534_053220 [Acytostelium subglobosum LB1]GAM22147.1 hypothetical protein SAMD00019534_053220 [Acytostelium subglobosum LB1]|eukprot:XP_012755247.1 hypothetical protein SAMD00019534_053220 [Acytostelium subglobosum LB1]
MFESQQYCWCAAQVSSYGGNQSWRFGIVGLPLRSTPLESVDDTFEDPEETSNNLVERAINLGHIEILDYLLAKVDVMLKHYMLVGLIPSLTNNLITRSDTFMLQHFLNIGVKFDLESIQLHARAYYNYNNNNNMGMQSFIDQYIFKNDTQGQQKQVKNNKRVTRDNEETTPQPKPTKKNRK